MVRLHTAVREGETLQDRATERGVCLTEAEAMGLLELIMTFPGDLDPEQRAALVKLSDYCRHFLRDGLDANTHLNRTISSSLASPRAG